MAGRLLTYLAASFYFCQSGHQNQVFLRKYLQTSIWAPVLFFAAYLALGLSIYTDYGMSWDEALQRDHGMVTARYINYWVEYTEHEYFWQDLHEYPHRHYGVLFSTPMAWMEKEYLELDNFRKNFHLRHLFVFLLFWFSCIVFYRLLLKRFRHWAWAMLGVLFLVLSPRIFAHSFYNPKDLPLLSLYILSTASLFRFWLKPNWWNGLLHGLTSGLLISMRVVGLIMPLMTIFLLFTDMLFNKILEPKWYKRYSLGMLIYLPALAFFTVFFWPYLWECPWQNLQAAFDGMSQYAWQGKVLFNGAFIYGSEVGWDYIPHWMGITTPVLYLLLFGTGVASLFPALWRNIRRRRGKCLWARDEERKDWAALGLILAPILAVIVKDSVVYDGWRHMFFIYPCLIYLSVLGAQYIWEQIGHWQPQNARTIRHILVFCIALSMVATAVFMVRHHPHQNVYFNVLRSGNQFGKYDLDYWGNSYKQGMEALVEIDDRPVIRLAYASFPATLNYEYLAPHIKSRIELVGNWQGADYYISNYRLWASGLKRVREKAGPYAGEQVYHIEVGNTPILGIYRIEQE